MLLLLGHTCDPAASNNFKFWLNGVGMWIQQQQVMDQTVLMVTDIYGLEDGILSILMVNGSI